jgi:hypothetical protein
MAGSTLGRCSRPGARRCLNWPGRHCPRSKAATTCLPPSSTTRLSAPPMACLTPPPARCARSGRSAGDWTCAAAPVRACGSSPPCARGRSRAPTSAGACSRGRALRTRTPRWCGPTPGPCPSTGPSTWRSVSERSGTSCPPNGPRYSPACTARCGLAGSSPSRSVRRSPSPRAGTGHCSGSTWPPFVMYYRTCPLHAVRGDLTASRFTVTTVPLTALGQRADGSPRYRLVLARKVFVP